ncbi:sulfatase family protein [Echinicola sediminis]
MAQHLWMIVFFLTFGWFSCSEKEQEVVKKPNLLFIFPDQLRNASIGINNQDPVITPHMDQLAREGMVIQNAISNFPLCSPYRAMLMTGKLPYHNAVLTNCNSKRYQYGNSWRKEDISFSDVLVANGYDAGYVGKLHLTSPPPLEGSDSVIWDAYTPVEERHGFNFWYSYGTFDQHFKPHYWVNDAPKEDLKYVDEWSAKHEADVIIDYINNKGKNQRDEDKPFAMFWSVNPPHPPYPLVPDKYLEPYRDKSLEDLLVRANVNLDDLDSSLAFHCGATRGKAELARDHVRDYFAMVTGVDDQIGRVLKALKAQGLEENTIVVITSDHGEMMGSHGLMSKNIWYDEAINVPFIIKWPGKIKQGQQSDLFVSVTDVMPTLLNMMGAKDGLPNDLDGRDLSKQLIDNSSGGADYALYYFIKEGAPGSGHRGIKTPKNTYVVTVDDTNKVREFLFDNVNDPFQMNNMVQADQKLATALREQLFAALKEKKDPWLENYRSFL